MRDKWKILVHPSWHEPLEPVSDHISDMGDFLRSEISQGHRYVPPGQQIFRAFADPFDQVRVLIVGQDPYPTPGHAMGLSFSVTESTQPLPKSLINIFTEYCTDLGYPQPRSGNLQPWSAQGVLLLNRVLTTRAGSPGAHQGKGWEKVTEQAITALVARGNSQPLVSILWGRQAATLKPLLAHGHVIESAHPSPLSAHRGFFGSQPFSRTNTFLQQCGMPHLDWRLP